MHHLPLTSTIIKIEKQGVLKRGESKKDRVRHRKKVEIAPRRTTGFGHNSITLVLLSSGIDESLSEKEITVKIFQNGVFHITGVLDEKYDRHVTSVLQSAITATPDAVVSGEWTPNERRVVLMNYKTKLQGVDNLSREVLYTNIRKQGYKTNYEPGVYPAVKIYFADTKWIAKVFRTGQIILTGMTTAEECAMLVKQLETALCSGLVQAIRAPT